MPNAHVRERKHLSVMPTQVMISKASDIRSCTHRLNFTRSPTVSKTTGNGEDEDYTASISVLYGGR